MKNLYSFFITCCILISTSLFSQQHVTFKINHKLGTSAFAFNQATTNNLDNSFTVTRLEYYISEIKLIHDGGTVTSIPDSYILVDASSPTSVNLGSYNITNLESISFGIGVESPKNNEDPNLYPATHPLGPKSPSMHWGWSAGYRFVALEGNTGASLNEMFQIHALGNRNYFTQNISTIGSLQNGILIVELNADYTQALAGITVNSNLLNHGETGEAATLLSNFRTGVFSLSTIGIHENDKLTSMAIYPNPSNGEINILLNKVNEDMTYTILDLVGKEIQQGKLTANNKQLIIKDKGIFFLNIYNNGVLVSSEKVIIH